MGTLSVRENLAFSANLRLSNDIYSEEDRREKVSEVIQQLGLQECADTKVEFCIDTNPLGTSIKSSDVSVLR